MATANLEERLQVRGDATNMSKRQFDKGANQPLFYERKIRKIGHSRVVAISKVLPAKWSWVRLSVTDSDEKHVLILAERLELKKPNAPTSHNDKERQQSDN